MSRTTRRSQSVVPFGVGSIVEFEDEALMPAGLDVWPEDCEILQDTRLASRLRVESFRIPPAKPEWGQTSEFQGRLPYVRFPRWHFCPRCRFLKKASLCSHQRPKCDNTRSSKRLGGKPPCGTLPDKRRPRMLPLRFVAVCEAGHISDFPWNAWAHSSFAKPLDINGGCTPENLYFYATRGGGLGGLKVECSECGAFRSLRGSTSRNGLKGIICKGERPWLGEDAQEICTARRAASDQAQMVAIQRGASNLYFPEVASSILIPPYSSRVHQLIREPHIWNALTGATTDGRIPEIVFTTIARTKNVEPAELKQAYLDRMGEDLSDTGLDVDETEFRYREYRALQIRHRKTDDLLACRPQIVEEYGEPVRSYFGHVTLVERLAETRALTGFSRYTPSNDAPAALSKKRTGWLPAFRVHGEGLFFTLNQQVLEGFESATPQEYRRYLERIRSTGRVELAISRELVLLHTLAHVLIKRLSWEAGYGSSSIRERIYSAPPGHKRRMSGVLLYTAAGDADGTLGGLVGLGRPGNLERIVLGALEDSRWCASDPICFESQAQGPDSVNRAACHACALLPETSCELQNRVLDRRPLLDFFRDATG